MKNVEVVVSLLSLTAGTVMLTLSVSKPTWFGDSLTGGDLEHLGLWKKCFGGDNDYCQALDPASFGWITGPKTMECLSLSCAVGALALCFRMLFHQTRMVCGLSAVLALLSGLLGLSGAALFYAKAREVDAAWCFYLNVTADILMVLSGGVITVHM